MTPATIITQTKFLIQDSQLAKSPDEHLDVVLLNLVNQAVQTMAVYRPDIFAKVSDVVLTANSVLQFAPTDALRLIDVLGVTGGNIIREVSLEAMDLSTPGWISATAATPVHWMRHPRNPTGFYVYPKPTAGITATVEYAASPPDYTVSDTIAVPAAYASALSAEVGANALLIFSDPKDAALAQTLAARFQAMVVKALDTRALTDYPSSALDQKQIIE